MANDTEAKRADRRVYLPSPLERITSALPFLQPSPSPSPASGSPLPPWLTDALSDPATAALVSATAAAAVTLVGVGVYRRYFRRLRNADSVTGNILEKSPWITGVVTR